MGYGQKGTDRGCACLQATQGHSRDTRRRVGSYVQRQTEIRNGVTLCRAHRRTQGGSSRLVRRAYGRTDTPGLNRAARMSRCQPDTARGGIPPDAKAARKARGYADVETVVCT